MSPESPKTTDGSMTRFKLEWENGSVLSSGGCIVTAASVIMTRPCLREFTAVTWKRLGKSLYFLFSQPEPTFIGFITKPESR